MTKTFGWALVAVTVVVLIVGIYMVVGSGHNLSEVPVSPAGVVGYKDGTYVLDDMLVTLEDGVRETPVGGDASATITTRYFGNELYKDLNGDGREDVVFLVTQEEGGSGTFFYVVAALNTERGYIGSRGVLLGDRIAPQTTESGPGDQVIVNYADRAVDEPMTTSPSVGKTIRLIFDDSSMQFGEVASDFEGEADPNKMTLGMKEWVWQKAEYNDGRTIAPNRAGAFTLTFLASGDVEVKTDCNHVGGGYSTDGSLLTFGALRTTLMYCEGSQEAEFGQLLADTSSFHFTNRGELVLDLKNDSGTATFR